MVEPRIVERDDPEDVFSLLSDDSRVRILQALWETDGPMAFSELREATGIRDSAQFNYHLNELVGQFVRKSPDGYDLTQAGRGINGAIEAGAYTVEATFEPIDIEAPCSYCGGDRTLTYEDDVALIECDSCEVSYRFAVPPGVFAGYDVDAIPRVASRYLHTTFHQIRSGFCWFCEGHTRPTVEIEGPPDGTADEDGPERGDPVASDGVGSEARNDIPPNGSDAGDADGEKLPIVQYDCERCGHTATAGLLMATIDHPDVRSFYHEHGIDVRDHPVWDFPALDPEQMDVRSRDPFRASVIHTAGGETLTLVLNEDADVVEVDA